MGAVLLFLSGLAYLAYKAEYLGLDAPDTLKAFIVSPGAALLIAATFVTFPDARRRFGGTLLALGIVAVLWTMERDGLRRGWTFYGPYPALEAERVFTSFAQPAYRPRLVAATLLVPLGMALIARGRPVAAVLLSLAALTCLLSPSRILLGISLGDVDGMPRRYHYYYVSPDATAMRLDAAIPAMLGMAGIVMWLLERYRSLKRRNETR